MEPLWWSNLTLRWIQWASISRLPASGYLIEIKSDLKVGIIRASPSDAHQRFEQMRQLLAAFTMFIAGVAAFPADSAETAPVGSDADELVVLVKPHESEAHAIRFMIAVAPMDMPAGLADCTVKEAMPGMRSYFASQFAENLSKTEMQQAIEFFRSPAGQAIVALRLKHEQSLFDTAMRKEQIADEHVHYPAPLQQELATFGATPAGRFFVGDELLARETIRTHVSDLRSEAMAKCLVAVQ